VRETGGVKSLLYLFRPCGPAYAIDSWSVSVLDSNPIKEKGTDLLQCTRTIEPLVAQQAAFSRYGSSADFSALVKQGGRGLPVLFLPHARGSGLVLSLVGVRGERVEGERYGHLVELGRGGESGEVMPVGEGIDGEWEFIGKEGRGVSRGGRWDSISGRLLAMRDQLVMEAVVVENGRMHGCLWGRRETERAR
jgi:hypothetical protein